MPVLAPESACTASERLQAVHFALAPHGMQLQVLGCVQCAPSAGAAAQQALAVTLMVLDSERAADVLHGPLADGEEVDMGSRAQPTEAGLQQCMASAAQPLDLSPDVLYNRAWLSAVMVNQGFIPVAGCWWAFVLP